MNFKNHSTKPLAKMSTLQLSAYVELKVGLGVNLGIN